MANALFDNQLDLIRGPGFYAYDYLDRMDPNRTVESMMQHAIDDFLMDKAKHDSSRPIISNKSGTYETNVKLNRETTLQLKKEFELVKTNSTEFGSFGFPLQGQKVCVLNANGGVKTQDLQKILIQFGAQPIAHPSE